MYITVKQTHIYMYQDYLYTCNEITTEITVFNDLLHTLHASLCHDVTNTNTNTIEFNSQEQSPYTCKRTNVKQVVNINIHYIKDKIKKSY